MRFLFVEISNVLGLHGKINFSENPVLFYGKNLSGKTNIVNLIRYCFVLHGRVGREYAEEKRLNRNELLLDGTGIGYATFYFEHRDQSFKLEYHFRRSSALVNQRIILCKAPLLPKSECLEVALNNAIWSIIASNVNQLNEEFIEFGIYYDMINVLISPSNVRNFAQAVSGKLVPVPEIIAKEISALHSGAEKIIGNLEKMRAVTEQEKEKYQERIKSIEKEFQQFSSKSSTDIREIFVLGSVFANLDKEMKHADEELSKIPTGQTKLELLKQKWGSEFREKLQEYPM
jgi:DNA repair exonuclease SbcCD ATPase subunit